jgi:hypothetical protein
MTRVFIAPRWCVVVVVFALLSLPLIGCGGGGGSLNPVEGKVTVDDKAIAAGSVAFHPDESKGNKSKKVAVGDITDGSYKLFTDGKPGAPPGWYKVTIAAQTQVDSDKAELAKSLVADKFTDPMETPLLKEVTASPSAGAYDLKVSAR